MPHEIPLGIAAFVALLGGALLISVAAERFKIPGAVMLVAVGSVVGSTWHVHPPFAFGPAVLFGFLPPLIFEAAWHIDLASLRTQIARVSIMAVAGTIVTAFAVAYALAAAGELPFSASLLLGAMISATDPVAVIAVFQEAAVPARVRTLVEAESLSNDGVAVVLYGVALVAASGGDVHVVGAIERGIFDVVAGVAVGAGCTVVFWLVLRATEASEYEVASTICLAYIAYLVADRARVSPIFATAASGIALRWLLHHRSYMRNRPAVDTFWNSAAYLANGAVFLATGLLINLPRALHEPVLALVAVAAVAVSRAAFCVFAGPGRAERITVLLAGMRGALPLALALGLPNGLAYRPQIIDGVFAIVLATLVVQGVSLEPVVTRLYGKAALP